MPPYTRRHGAGTGPWRWGNEDDGFLLSGFLWHGKNQKLKNPRKNHQNDQIHQVKRVLAQSVCYLGKVFAPLAPCTD